MDRLGGKCPDLGYHNNKGEENGNNFAKKSGNLILTLLWLFYLCA